MWLVLTAMRRPITIVVVMVAIGLVSVIAIQRMKVDIFPQLGVPAIYVAQPYGGMDPAQMEGYLTYYYEYHFLYITGIEHVESKNIQGVALMKLVFHPGTDMSQAMAETVGYVNRARAFMPPGTVPPFIMRFDAGSVPVGYLVFSSDDAHRRARCRTSRSTASGRSSPRCPACRRRRRSAAASARSSSASIRSSCGSTGCRPTKSSPPSPVEHAFMPSGNVRIGDLMRIAPINATLGGNIQELLDAPLRLGDRTDGLPARRRHGQRHGPTSSSATRSSTAGARSTSRSPSAPTPRRSTSSSASGRPCPRCAALRRTTSRSTCEFDQSRYVVQRAHAAWSAKALLGAVLTGLMVLLFLRDWRSALIVVLDIPLALLAAVVALWVTGQTINIMTLGGLALAVGILVDEATVEIENIHTQLAAGLVACARGARGHATRPRSPRLLAMLCVLAVFVPSFFMTGVGASCSCRCRSRSASR